MNIKNVFFLIMDRRKEVNHRTSSLFPLPSSFSFSHAFTLLELLVVIGIMGLLGTASVGGYRAMQRGMEERGVLDNVSAFVRTAYQRAQIDRQPTAIYFWNETLREETESQTAIVVGKAVAVRRGGRISEVDGQNLFDEFADLNLTYKSDTDDSSDANTDKDNTFYLYPLDKLSDVDSDSDLPRSLVSQKVKNKRQKLLFLSGKDGNVPNRRDLQSEGLDDYINDGSSDQEGSLNGNVVPYGFQVLEAGNVKWETGTAYGFEFAHLELPHGFIFGNKYSKTQTGPIKLYGTMVFKPGVIRGNGVSGQTGLVNGKKDVVVYSLRPGSDGSISAHRVGESTDPTKTLY